MKTGDMVRHDLYPNREFLLVKYLPTVSIILMDDETFIRKVYVSTRYLREKSLKKHRLGVKHGTR